MIPDGGVEVLPVVVVVVGAAGGRWVVIVPPLPPGSLSVALYIRSCRQTKTHVRRFSFFIKCVESALIIYYGWLR